MNLYKNWGGERTGWITRESLDHVCKYSEIWTLNEFNTVS